MTVCIFTCEQCIVWLQKPYWNRNTKIDNVKRISADETKDNFDTRI